MEGTPYVARHPRTQVEPLPVSGELPPAGPRPLPVRVLGGLAAVAVLAVPQLFVPFAFLGAVEPLGGPVTLLRTVLYVVLTLPFLPALPLVSYRRRDWLVVLAVPGWQWVLAFRVGYRLAFLPYRDWQPRPDEVVHARRVRGAKLWVRR